MKIIIELDSPNEFPKLIQQFQETFSVPNAGKYLIGFEPTPGEIKYKAADETEAPKKNKAKKTAPQTNLQDSAPEEKPPEEEKREALPMVEESEKDRVLSVFKLLYDKRGSEACMEMLKKFEVKRISEVPLEAYPRFIRAACEQLLAQ